MADRSRESADGALILALAGGATLRDAARAAQVSERTARRRMESEDFRRQVLEERGRLLTEASAKLIGTMSEAADALRGLLSSTNDVVKLGACRAVLQMALSVRQAAEIEARITALENAHAAGEDPEFEARRERLRERYNGLHGNNGDSGNGDGT